MDGEMVRNLAVGWERMEGKKTKSSRSLCVILYISLYINILCNFVELK